MVCLSDSLWPTSSSSCIHRQLILHGRASRRHQFGAHLPRDTQDRKTAADFWVRLCRGNGASLSANTSSRPIHRAGERSPGCLDTLQHTIRRKPQHPSDFATLTLTLFARPLTTPQLLQSFPRPHDRKSFVSVPGHVNRQRQARLSWQRVIRLRRTLRERLPKKQERERRRETHTVQ